MLKQSPLHSLLRPALRLCLCTAAMVTLALPTHAQTPQKTLISDEVVADIRNFIDREIVRMSIANQNTRYGDLAQSEIDRLDTQWVAETNAKEQPLISAVLANPLSAYLTRIQARSSGLYTEIFVMDQNGLNVGQSNPSSDFWQGDEAKFQKTFPVSGQAIFIDEPEYNDDTHTWNTQVNLSITDGTSPDAIGAATVEVNLTELQRRQNARRAKSQPIQNILNETVGE